MLYEIYEVLDSKLLISILGSPLKSIPYITWCVGWEIIQTWENGHIYFWRVLDNHIKKTNNMLSRVVHVLIYFGHFQLMIVVTCKQGRRHLLLRVFKWTPQFLKNMLEFLKKCKKKKLCVYIEHPKLRSWTPCLFFFFFIFFFSTSPRLLLLCPIFLLSFIAQTHLFLFLFLCFICLFCLWLMSLQVWGTWYLKKVESKCGGGHVELECFENYLLFIFNGHSCYFSLFNVPFFAFVLWIFFFLF